MCVDVDVRGCVCVCVCGRAGITPDTKPHICTVTTGDTNTSRIDNFQSYRIIFKKMSCFILHRIIRLVKCIRYTHIYTYTHVHKTNVGTIHTFVYTKHETKLSKSDAVTGTWRVPAPFFLHLDVIV